MYGKVSLVNKIPQKGVVSEEGLRHEYREGCIFRGGLVGVIQGGIQPIYLHLPCLSLICFQGIVQWQQCYDL